MTLTGTTFMMDSTSCLHVVAILLLDTCCMGSCPFQHVSFASLGLQPWAPSGAEPSDPQFN